MNHELFHTFKVRTSGGNVALGRIDGPVNAQTSGGNVKLAGCTQDAVLKTSGGSIDAGPVARDLQIHTSGGSIRINGAEGAVNARTSGGTINANLAKISSECVLSTSGGSVHVQLDKSCALLLDAMTSGGRVWTNDNLQIATLAGGYGKNRLAGKVNGGGPLLKLRTSGGNIDVKAQ